MSECREVYKLTCNMTDPRFSACFTIAPEARSVLGHEQAYDDLQLIDGSSIHWKTHRLAEHWRPMPVVGRVNPFNDYPGKWCQPPNLGNPHLGNDIPSHGDKPSFARHAHDRVATA